MGMTATDAMHVCMGYAVGSRKGQVDLVGFDGAGDCMAFGKALDDT